MPLTNPNLIIAVHLLLLYISWGSIYLCLQTALEVAGPFILCGIRMLAAGVLLGIYLWLRGQWRKVTKKDLLNSAWLAVFMVVIGGCFLGKGQEYVPSGIAAVVNGSTPISMALAAWLFAGEERPNLIQWLGLLGGMAGLLLLVGSKGGLSFENKNIIGILWIYMSTLGWVFGSLLSKRSHIRIHLPELQSCVLLFLAGGLQSLLLGLLFGEGSECQWQNFDLDVFFAFAWMIIVSSIFAYICYFWLLNHASTIAAISYEYVVPVIGLFLGWLLGNETVNGQTILACALLVTSVFFVLHHKHGR